MNTKWIKNNGNSKVIIFFNGWGMDESAVEHMSSDSYDIFMINDYTEIESLTESFDNYNSVYVIAWSLGVWGASQILSLGNIKLEKAISINGTLKPVDNDFGIPKLIFKGTIDGWAERTRKRFQMRVIGGASVYQENIDRFGKREVEDQKQELISIYEKVKSGENQEFTFDIAVIGNQDAIFTPENQKSSWAENLKCLSFDMPHYPFLFLNNWQQIIDL